MDHHPTYTGSSESNSLTIPIEPSSRLHFHQFLLKFPWVYLICPNFSRDLSHIPPQFFHASIYKNSLVNIQTAIKNCHGNTWFSHSKWWFSIVFCFLYVYQRVFPYFPWVFSNPPGARTRSPPLKTLRWCWSSWPHPTSRGFMAGWW